MWLKELPDSRSTDLIDCLQLFNDHATSSEKLSKKDQAVIMTGEFSLISIRAGWHMRS